MTTAKLPDNSASKGNYHSQWIDFLRGASALAVVLYHVRVDLWVGWNAIRAQPDQFSAIDKASAWLSVGTPFMGSAVMLFFMVSGFCVHFAYAAGGRPFEAGPYARRRFFRIYPPYLAIIAVTFIIERLALALYTVPGSSWQTIVKTIFMVQNYGFAAGQMSANPSLWSLPVEAELYLAYPLFLWCCANYGFKVTMSSVAIISVGVLLISLQFPWDSGVFHPDYNFLLFWIIWCGGALLAEMLKRDRLPRWNFGLTALMICLLLIALVADLKRVPVGVHHLLWGAFYFLLMLWGLCKAEALRAVPIWLQKPILSIGVFSYALYLVHFPLFHLLGAMWVHQFGAKPANFLVSLVFVALSLPVAALFYRWFELPSHTWARKFGAAHAKVPAKLRSS